MALVGLGGWLWGCGDADMTRMSDYTQAFSFHLDALGNEQAAHSSQISTMIGVDRIGPVEKTHADRMDDHLARMSSLLGGMMSCADDRGSPFDAANFASATHDLHLECDQHGMLMMSAHDMETATSEEARHQSVVGMKVERLRRLLGTTAQSASTYTCSRCPSCGM
jgi:hypothetical protein